MTWTYYYDLLGVAPSASREDLDRAYSKLAGKYHPDLNPSRDAASRWARISQAYAVLSDPVKRQAYDKHGHAGFTPQSDTVARLFSGAPPPTVTPATPSKARRGADLYHTLVIRRDEAIRGAEKGLQVLCTERCTTCTGAGTSPQDLRAPCLECSGTGVVHARRTEGVGSTTPCMRCQGIGSTSARHLYLQHYQGIVMDPPCQVCDGRGFIRTSRYLRVTVPPGVTHGQQLRLTGAGHPGADGSAPGNLYVRLAVQ